MSKTQVVLGPQKPFYTFKNWKYLPGIYTALKNFSLIYNNL